MTRPLDPAVQARRAQVLALSEAGKSVREISRTLGINEDLVAADRVRIGFAKDRRKVWTEEETRRAQALLDDGCPYSEVSRTLGISVACLQHKFPGRGWRGNQLGNGKHARLAEALGLTLR